MKELSLGVGAEAQQQNKEPFLSVDSEDSVAKSVHGKNQQIICGDSVEVIQTFPDKTIDLVVTSPPYFNIQKKYQRGTGFHYSKDFGEPLYVVEDVSQELLRVLKNNGAFCLNLGFSYGETGVLRPFYVAQRLLRQGWICVDTIIWHKNNPVPLRERLTNSFEYIFVFAKTPEWRYKKTINYEHNVWMFPIQQGEGNPAGFPEELPKRCIELMSLENDVVLDPFVGNGTTCIIAKKLQRQWIGIDINPEYCEIARKRLATVPEKLDGFMKIPEASA